jgi:hypothetical protein
MSENQKNELGKLAYNTYRIGVNNKSFNGDDLKEFDELPEGIRKSWGLVEAVIAEKTKLQNEITKLENAKSEMLNGIDNKLKEFKKE